VVLFSLKTPRGLRPRRVFFSGMVAVLIVAFKNALRRFKGDY